jgi:hypothetical protein
MAKKKRALDIEAVPVELISLAELGRRAGVTRQAAQSWVSIQNKEGADLFIDDGAAGGSKSRSTAQKIIEFTRKLEIKNSDIRSGYVARDFAFLYLETELQFSHKHMKAYSAQVAREIEKTFFGKLTKEDKKMLADFKQSIDKEVESVLMSLDRLVKEFKEKHPIQYEEITAATAASPGQ